MTSEQLEDLAARLGRVEDELAIRRVVLSYGPAADGGLAARAAGLWADDGVYDFDATREPFGNRAAVEAMLGSDNHREIIGTGAAHLGGAPLIELDGDRATALTYSLVVRRDVDEGRFYIWRLSAARWDLERVDGSWRVRRRTHRMLDETGVGRDLFADTLQACFEEGR